MMGWDDEDDRACAQANRTGSRTSDFEAVLWYSIPTVSGALFIIGKLFFGL